MQQFSTQAIVLRRTNYGEADRIVSFLTPDHGKLSAIAKGVRKPKSKLAGGLELFATCDITVLPGRGDLGVVTSTRLHQFYRNILSDYDRMQLGYEFIKQINRATETVSEPEFYYLLQHSLAYLNALNIDWRLVELWFWLHFATLLGQGFNMATDKNGQPLQANATYSFDTTDRTFFSDERGRFSGDHIKLLRLCLAKTPDVLRQVQLAGSLLDDCVWLARNGA